VREPRHPSWFADDPARLLEAHRVGRPAPDPAPVPVEGEPGGWAGIIYFRLHGSPRMYYSAYDEPYLDALAERMRPPPGTPTPSGASSTTPRSARRPRTRSACSRLT
jgi:uncharacterized protein YecE (DUF72 family)